jgi:hypothetical protein
MPDRHMEFLPAHLPSVYLRQFVYLCLAVWLFILLTNRRSEEVLVLK